MRKLKITLLFVALSIVSFAQKGTLPEPEKRYVQKSVMIFAKSFFTDDGNGNHSWTGNNQDMIDWIKQTLKRNCVYISTRALNVTKYGTTYYSNYDDFISRAKLAGLKVYAMPIADDDFDYYLPSHHSEAIADLNNKFIQFQNRVPVSPNVFDGIYCDIEPWPHADYKAAKSAGNYALLNTYIQYYQQLISFIRTTWAPANNLPSNFFIAYATNMKWHEWAEYSHPTDFTHGFNSVFINAGATAIVPQLYCSKSAPTSCWTYSGGYRYNYSWLTGAGGHGVARYNHIGSGEGVVLGLSAFSPYYTTTSGYLYDEGLINDLLRVEENTYKGSCLYGYEEARYHFWGGGINDGRVDTSDHNTSRLMQETATAKAYEELRTYPNPTQNSFQIANEIEGGFTVRVYTKTGQLVMEVQNQRKLDLSHLAADIYAIVLQNEHCIHQALMVKAE